MLRAMSAPAAPCVLVVEDESAIADTVLYALRSEGYQVRHCLLGREALAQARAGGIDVVVLDVGLPDRAASRYAANCAASARCR
ncbi:hypothetical protein XTALMG727_1032 [Xanthomonas translucens pv. arrhenatheri LMG 727]|uniref:Response regulatory domain-containing protein n=2 Tax=Xanthomonas graminis TaxID=3390026 RepID=A0A0K2ZJZ4_9XANT|nr:hypothetical protein XTALMG727_1032 [Xanthomonas translucens pv. arrhenatheri LMG 727]CTP90042.1 hypothetical protein XTPLMG730_2678 [Xanthomonas translucens pv. phlei]